MTAKEYCQHLKQMERLDRFCKEVEEMLLIEEAERIIKNEQKNNR